MSYKGLMHDLSVELAAQMSRNPTGRAVVYLWPSVTIRPGVFRVCDSEEDFSADPYAGWHLNGPRFPRIIRPLYSAPDRWEAIAYVHLYATLYEACRREPCMGPGDDPY